MAGRGPAPKPAEQRRRRNAPSSGEWVDLPRSGRSGPAPKWMLPGKPSTEVARLWRWAWSTPQATRWEGLALEPFVARWAMLTVEATRLDDLGAERVKGVFAELRQIEDRLGLNPKGLQDRRWRLAAEADTTPADKPGTVTRMDRYRDKVGAD